MNNNDDLVSEFDASTYSGDSFYDIFDNEEEIITEGSVVWVKTNKNIWGGRVIKNTFHLFHRGFQPFKTDME